MAANTNPIFVLTPHISWALVSASNESQAANFNGTGVLGTDIQTVFTATTNGSRIDSITIRPLGTNKQCVVSLFINNGSNNTIATNNAQFYAVTMQATTINTSSVLPQKDIQFPNGIILPSGYKILSSVSTTVATGFHVIAFGGDY